MKPPIEYQPLKGAMRALRRSPNDLSDKDKVF